MKVIIFFGFNGLKLFALKKARNSLSSSLKKVMVWIAIGATIAFMVGPYYLLRQM